MIQVKNVVDAIYGMIGWRKDLSDNIDIASSLTVSESGLYYQDAHPLLTLKNLQSIAPDFSNRVWDEYDSAKTYRKDSVVRYDGSLYICLADGTTGQDPETSGKWAHTDPFSLWLEEKTRASISNVVSRFIYSVMPKGGTKSILEHRLLFNSVGRLADRVENKGNLVGLEVHPIQAYDACVRLHKIGVQTISLSDITTINSLRLLVKSSNDVAGSLFDGDVDVGGARMRWSDINLDVDNKDGGQSLYAFYDQRRLDEIGHEAINRTIDWSKAPCPSCSTLDYQAYIAWSKYIEVHPFYVEPADILADPYVFDQQKMVYVNNTNFGLNLEISVYCDYTDFMIRNKGEFITLLMKQLAVDMLREFAYNPNVRANRNSVNVSRTDVIFALDGSSEKLGMIRELDDLYKGINFSMRGLDKVCRPCCNNGLRYTTT